MEVIYIDRLFLLNLLADYLLCLVSARVCGLCLKRLRYVLAAALGAFYAVLTLLPGCEWLNGPVGKLSAAVLMALIAYGGEAHAFRCGMVFLSVSAAFGGAVWAISLAGGGSAAVSASPRVLLLSFALCYAAITLLFRGKARLLERPRAEVTLRHRGKSCRFTALRDTGNRLSDPLSGQAVLLASPHALRPLFGQAAELFTLPDPVALLEALGGFPELKGQFRLIPYTAVGVSGLLPVFRPEQVLVDGKAEQELLVAISPSAAGDDFEGIV